MIFVYYFLCVEMLVTLCLPNADPMLWVSAGMLLFSTLTVILTREAVWE